MPFTHYNIIETRPKAAWQAATLDLTLDLNSVVLLPIQQLLHLHGHCICAFKNFDCLVAGSKYKIPSVWEDRLMQNVRSKLQRALY